MRLRPEANATIVSVDALLGGVLLRTLEPAVAALNRLFDSVEPAAASDGEPDGISGVERRGPLSRLLASEWLLAGEAPDEFMRRLDRGELGYRGLAQAEPKRPQTTLVLFDAGPDQLGNPRLAQLATLVVMARRSAAAGAELQWGTLQHPAGHPVGGAALDRFLAARTLAPPRELPPDAFVDECLVVSPLPGPPYPAQQLVLGDAGTGVAAHLIDRRSGTSGRPSRACPERPTRCGCCETLPRALARAAPAPVTSPFQTSFSTSKATSCSPHRTAPAGHLPRAQLANGKTGPYPLCRHRPPPWPYCRRGEGKRDRLHAERRRRRHPCRAVLLRWVGRRALREVPCRWRRGPGAHGGVPVGPRGREGRGVPVRVRLTAPDESRGRFLGRTRRPVRPVGPAGPRPVGHAHRGGWLIRSGQEEWRYDSGPVLGILPRIR